MKERAVTLLGRDEERGHVEGFLSAPRPAMLLIEGEPGIGKTTLWQHGVETAERRGFRVLAFRPGEAERSLTYAGLSGLLTDAVLDEALPNIPEPRRRALEGALLRSGEGARTVDPTTAGLAVLSVLEFHASTCSLLLAVDDLQWTDDTSVGVLAFALRRLRDADVAVLGARRQGGDEPGPVAAAFPEERRDRIALGPLSVGALGRLVHERLGLVLPRVTAARLRRESRGNPFFAMELARAMKDRGSLPAPGEPLLLPQDVATLLGERIDRLPREASEALLAISALARPTVGLLERVMGVEAADGALAELALADLVRAEGEDARTIHPLIASAAYARSRPRTRRALHRRLADAVDDVEERARHLALASPGPDGSVARALDEAAALAQRRGASEAAAELAELAVSLTPPADLPGMARRELALAEHQVSAGSVTGALDAVTRAIELLPPGPGRVDALITLGRIEAADFGDGASGRRRFQQALEEAGDDRTARIRAHIGFRWADELQDATGELEAEHARAVLDLLAGREHEDPYSAANALVMLAEAKFRSGQGLDVELLDRAVELEPPDLPLVNRSSKERAIGLGIAGRHRESIRALETCLVQAEQEGDWGIRPTLWRCLAWMGWCTGDLHDAATHIDQAMVTAGEIGLDAGIIWALGAVIRAAMGHLDQARDWSARAIQRGREGFWWWELRGHAAAVFLQLTIGDVAPAAGGVTTALDIADRLGSQEPGWDRIHADLVEALLALGDTGQAERITGWLETAAASGRHPWTMLAAERCRGLLEAAVGRWEEAVACFDRALAADVRGDMALERARTLLVKGQVLRRANQRRAGRSALAEAHGVFLTCGAAPWADRTRGELAAVSGRVARPTELTGMERRVAELAASGRKNGEIAGDLFLSVRTVESHLSSVYRKLGVRSRTELASTLLEGPPAAGGR